MSSPHPAGDGSFTSTRKRANAVMKSVAKMPIRLCLTFRCGDLWVVPTRLVRCVAGVPGVIDRVFLVQLREGCYSWSSQQRNPGGVETGNQE